MKTRRYARKNTNSDIRTILKTKGYSLAGWARANGYNRVSTHLALVGRMNGSLAREIRAKVQNLKG